MARQRYNVAVSDRLIVNEVFRSILGESTRAGLPCVIVRLTGCNLRCRWCDTTYAFDEGETMPLDQVLARIAELCGRRVLLTGGEPLCQAGALELLKRLCDAGYQTLLETNGTQDITPVDPRVVRIVDIKCPSSGAENETRWEGLADLRKTDEVKLVIADRADYEYARQVVGERKLTETCPVVFQPVSGELRPDELAAWTLEDQLDVRLGVQLHKMIWPDKARGV